MKKILITGGNGFLGRALAKKLKKNYKIFLGSRNNGQNLNAEIETGCKSIPLDITQISSITDALNYIKPDTVIHAAATKFVGLSEEFPFECVDVNILGSSNIVRACIDKKIKNVIGISTDKATPPQNNFYGMSKAMMEKIFLNASKISKTKFTCVRFGNISWSTGSVFPIWKKMYDKNKIINTTGPNMRRFFFSVEEAANLVYYALKNIKKYNGMIVIKKMKSARMIDFLNMWMSIMGGKYNIVKKRLGDAQDEFLIGETELDYTKTIENKYYIIDYQKKTKRKIKSPISSKNARRLNNQEIKKLLKF